MLDSEFQHNFHTHTYRCKHAEGDVGDYCEMAISMGMKTLGISDHAALPDDRWLSARMRYIDLPEYNEAINQAKIKYPQLRILKGMECEYIPEQESWYKDELFGVYQFDYLIGAAHFFLDSDEKWTPTYGGTNSAKALIEFGLYTARMMESGLFDFIAHPDLFGNCYEKWDANCTACTRDIMAAASETGVGLEVNALGIRKQAAKSSNNPFPLYPWIPFWEEASNHNVRVIVNSDAHRPSDLQGKTGDAFQIVNNLNLNHMDVACIGTKNRES